MREITSGKYPLKGRIGFGLVLMADEQCRSFNLNLYFFLIRPVSGNEACNIYFVLFARLLGNLLLNIASAF